MWYEKIKEAAKNFTVFLAYNANIDAIVDVKEIERLFSYQDYLEADGRELGSPHGPVAVFGDRSNDHALNTQKLSDFDGSSAVGNPFKPQGLLAQDLLHLATLH